MMRSIFTLAGLSGVALAATATATTTTLNATRDTSSSEAYPTYTEGATDRLYLFGGGGGNNARALLGFEPLPSGIAGAEVVSATVRVELARAWGDTVEIRPMTHDWTEGTSGYNPDAGGADWNTYDGTNPWPSGAGGGLGSTLPATDSETLPNLGVNASGNFIEWDVTSAVKLWADGTLPNYGFIFNVSVDPGAGAATQFHSRETTTGTAPVLILDTIVVPPGWALNGSGDWNVAANWSHGLPNGVDAVANFGTIITSAQTVYTNTAVTVGTLKFDSPNTYLLAGLGSLSIEVSSGTGSVDVVQGSHKINLPLFFASDTSVAVAGGATLTISDPVTIRAGKTVTKSGTVLIEAPLTLEAGATLVTAGGRTTLFGAPSLGTGAKIDLKNTSVTVDYRGQANPATTVKGQIAASAIMSSSAISNQTGLGWKDDSAAQSILVKYTYLGDTNLDGQVDVIDLGNLATAWQTSGVWVNGDSNYDNFVDVIDLGLLATNWQAGVGSPLGPGSLDQALAAYGLPSVSVPEPGALALMGLAVASLRRRPHRRS